MEHLTPEQYQCENGEKVIFDLLDQRWPQKDRTDEIGESIAEIFAMKGKDNETLRQWSARAQEAFDRCKRKCGVDFPPEVRGYVLLQCSGLSEQERAVVLARAQGNLKFDEVSQSMRSCFPDMVINRKRSTAAAHLVEDFEVISESPEPVAWGFDDVELLLAEHGLQDDDADALGATEEWEEAEAAEILAASWKGKRAELSKLQKARKFTQAADHRRAFRVEVEEVKRRSKCWKCHKIGHFARDCRASGPASSSSQGGGKEHAAGTVAYEGQSAGIPEHFICSGVWSPDHDDEHAVCLVSSPGFAVLDSGCGKTIVGEQTLQDFLAIWKAYELEPPKEILEQNAFRYGNGEREISQRVIEMPVTLANRRGIVRAAVVKGSAPLLLSRAALKTLKANIDFENDQLTLFGTKVPLLVNDARQYTVNVSKFNPVDRSTSPMTTAPAAPCADPSHDDEPETAEPGVQTSTCESVQINRKRDKVKDYWEVRPKDRVVIRHHLKPRRARFTPCHTQCPIDVEDLMPSRCTHVQLDHQPDVLQFCDQWTNPVDAHHVQSQGTWKGRTVFAIHPSVDLSRFETHAEQEVCLTQWTPKQHRQLMSQIRQGETSNSDQKLHVVEVFSPPRFALECEKLGYACVSADLCTGWDFRRPADRQLMRDIVAKRKPDLLMLCPPCTWAGGWFHLNRTHMTAEQVQEKTLLTRLFINFCCQLIQIQLKNGGRVVFEHPRDSVAWSILTQRFPQLLIVEVDMCSYGLAIPGGHLIRKPTRLLVSHADMQSLGKKCPGSENPKHRIHQPIAGYVSGIGRVSTHAGKYPAAFVKAVLASVKELPDTPVLVCDVAVEVECLAASRVAELNEADGEALKRSLTKLHSNLGHPPNQQLVRVLKHGGANEAAIQMARAFSCEQCASQVVPRAALPAQTHRTTEFNALVGIDVKYLTGWKANQRVPALNIVDYASSLQIMVPLFQKENSTLIREAFMERWVSWAGMPAEVVCDPAKPNVTDALTKPLEERGAAFKMTAADAHWQLGKTEVHGGWFDKILSKVITEQTPKDQTEWIACVHAAHCKNQLIQVYGMTPSQFVFGRNPRIPENLLDEPLEVPCWNFRTPRRCDWLSLHDHVTQYLLLLDNMWHTGVLRNGFKVLWINKENGMVQP